MQKLIEPDTCSSQIIYVPHFDIVGCVLLLSATELIYIFPTIPKVGDHTLAKSPWEIISRTRPRTPLPYTHPLQSCTPASADPFPPQRKESHLIQKTNPTQVALCHCGFVVRITHKFLLLGARLGLIFVFSCARYIKAISYMHMQIVYKYRMSMSHRNCKHCPFTGNLDRLSCAVSVDDESRVLLMGSRMPFPNYM